jgi:hypothetical protein
MGTKYNLHGLAKCFQIAIGIIGCAQGLKKLKVFHHARCNVEPILLVVLFQMLSILMCICFHVNLFILYIEFVLYYNLQ